MIVETTPLTQPSFNELVLAHLTGERCSGAIKSLQTYMTSFTGRHFEQLADADPFAITANDIIAVSALSVEIPPSAAVQILGPARQRISELLRRIPAGASITDGGELLSEDGAAWELYYLLRSFKGLGPTKVSKLMAAKRPSLIPIRGSVVADALGSPESWWSEWSNFMSGSEAIGRLAHVRSVATEAGALHLSHLRVLDIVIWMHQSANQEASGGSVGS